MSDTHIKTKSTGGLESTECVIQKVFAFAVPPRTSTQGYRAADWPKLPLWSGRLRVISKDGKLTILLEHSDKEGLFAQCPYENKSTVEPATDSSRYFVLRISDGKGRHAYIGIGFDKREEAFDFKVALQDAENAENNEDAVAFLSAPSQDLSLHHGEKIKVSFGSHSELKKDTKKEEGEKPKLVALAPPPKGGAKTAPRKPKFTNTNNKSLDRNDPSQAEIFQAIDALKNSTINNNNSNNSNNTLDNILNLDFSVSGTNNNNNNNSKPSQPQKQEQKAKPQSSPQQQPQQQQQQQPKSTGRTDNSLDSLFGPSSSSSLSSSSTSSSSSSSTPAKWVEF